MGGMYAPPAWLSSGVTLPGGAVVLLGGLGAEHCITQNVFNITSAVALIARALIGVGAMEREGRGRGRGGERPVRLEV